MIFPIDINAVTRQLQIDEGFRGTPYKDQFGNLTIGYGWNLGAVPITKQQASHILSDQIKDKYSELIREMPWIQTHPDPIQRALLNMAFNLGVNGLSKFTTFLSMIQDGHYPAAAVDLETTAWFSQVGNRAKRIQQLIQGTQS